MPNNGVERWRDPGFAPRLSAGVEALIAALPATYNEAIRAITDAGLAKSTATGMIKQAVRAGYLRGSGRHNKIRVDSHNVLGERSVRYRYEDTRTLEYVHWPKETENDN